MIKRVEFTKKDAALFPEVAYDPAYLDLEDDKYYGYVESNTLGNLGKRWVPKSYIRGKYVHNEDRKDKENTD